MTKCFKIFLFAVLSLLNFQKVYAQDNLEAFLGTVSALAPDSFSKDLPLIAIEWDDNHQDFLGWLKSEDDNYVYLLSVSAQEERIAKRDINKRTMLKLDADFERRLSDMIGFDFTAAGYSRGVSVAYSLVALYAHRKGDAVQAQRYERKIFKDDRKAIAIPFGNFYFNEMLQAYSSRRDYLKAIAIGQRFENDLFKDFRYRKTALKLAAQLRHNPDDFKTFFIPDSVSWSKLKPTLGRKSQLAYLSDRLRLMNCIQTSQPGDIYLGDVQTSISSSAIGKLSDGYNHREIQKKYAVINPYSEILRMKPDFSEAADLLPKLLDSTFVPTYSYWRDFHYGRNLYRCHWVVYDLLLEITKNKLFDFSEFEASNPDKKKKMVETARVWLQQFQNMSAEQQLEKRLAETQDWKEFKALLFDVPKESAQKISEVVFKRFGTFQNIDSPTSNGQIARFVLSRPAEANTKKALGWIARPNSSQVDDWVRFYAALYLLKNVPESEKESFAALSEILAKSNDMRHYSESFPLLLHSENPQALALAETMLYKFPDDWSKDNYVKALFLAKSDKAFQFLIGKLQETDASKAFSYTSNGKQVLQLACDSYVFQISGWRSANASYQIDWDIDRKIAYIDDLKKWLKIQFELVKSGKPNDIIGKSPTFDLPHWRVDSPGY